MIGICARTLAVAILAAAFVLSGVVHDVVPHDHGHGHADNAVWQQLHSGMRHEEKKTVALPLFVLLAVLLTFVCTEVVSRAIANIPPDPLRGRYLQKGIAPYRRFA